jgi:hypothetical protein
MRELQMKNLIPFVKYKSNKKDSALEPLPLYIEKCIPPLPPEDKKEEVKTIIIDLG